jgi:hypothetical protein
MKTKDLHDTIEKTFGRFNVDLLSGWEAGSLGKTRIAGKLFDRAPPEHLTGERYREWQRGYQASLARRPNKTTTFFGSTLDGQFVKIVRKGWVPRGPVMIQMESKGVCSPVQVCYELEGKAQKTVEVLI